MKLLGVALNRRADVVGCKEIWVGLCNLVISIAHTNDSKCNWEEKISIFGIHIIVRARITNVLIFNVVVVISGRSNVDYERTTLELFMMITSICCFFSIANSNLLRSTFSSICLTVI